MNLIAPVNGLGYGAVGLGLVKGLFRLVPLSWWPIGETEAPPEDMGILQAAANRAMDFDVDAPSVRLWHQHDMSLFPGRGLRAGFPIFELDRLTGRERYHLSWLDRVLVASDWALRVLVQSGIDEKRIRVAPLGVDAALFVPSPLPARSTTVFLHIGKWEIRKGADVLVQVFNKAFSLTDDVELVMHCHNPFLSEQEQRAWENVYRKSKLGSKIVITKERPKDRREVAALMSGADCGVFPARAEGWNLEALEMLSMGRHVIATDYAGHTAFLNHENAFLVKPGPLEPAFDGVWFHGQGEWASLGQGQIEQLVEHMLAVHKAKQEGNLSINQAGLATASKFSWENTARAVLEGIS